MTSITIYKQHYPFHLLTLQYDVEASPTETWGLHSLLLNLGRGFCLLQPIAWGRGDAIWLLRLDLWGNAHPLHSDKTCCHPVRKAKLVHVERMPGAELRPQPISSSSERISRWSKMHNDTTCETVELYNTKHCSNYSSVQSNSLQLHGLQHAKNLYYQLPKLAQTHVHRVSDAIQPSHRLSSPSPPAFNLSQHPGLFQWVTLNQVATWFELEFQLHHHSFQWILGWISFRIDWSPCSSRNSQESSPTPYFKSITSSVLSFLYSSTLITIHDYEKNHSFN